MEHPLEIIKKAALNGVLDYKASNTPEQIRIRVHQNLPKKLLKNFYPKST